jgi:hypothetical protein
VVLVERSVLVVGFMVFASLWALGLLAADFVVSLLLFGALDWDSVLR